MADDGECPKRMLEERCKPACTKYALAYEVSREEEIEGCGVGFGRARRLYARVFGPPLAVCGTGVEWAARGRPKAAAARADATAQKNGCFCTAGALLLRRAPCCLAHSGCHHMQSKQKGVAPRAGAGAGVQLNTHHPHSLSHPPGVRQAHREQPGGPLRGPGELLEASGGAKKESGSPSIDRHPHTPFPHPSRLTTCTAWTSASTPSWTST
jgi:hypothetical protein